MTEPESSIGPPQPDDLAPSQIPAGHASSKHHSRPYRRLVLADDLITDQALEDETGDEFHHTAIAKAVADLALSSVTPVNIALFGAWGSGKSTLYRLMKRRVDQQSHRVMVAYYDAWKYGGQDLKRNFIQEIARQVKLKKTSDLDRELTLDQEHSRLRLGAWITNNAWSIAGALLAAFFIASLWTTAHSGLEKLWLEPKRDFWNLFLTHINEFGLVLAGVLTTLLLGPKALESAIVKTTRPAADRDDQFARMFSKLVKRIKKETGAPRLVFFIDELDRCQPDDVVATLVDLKTFLDEPDCVFVVAADRDVLEHALRNVPQSKPIRDDDPYYSTPGAFIDKIFQHQLALPPLRHHALSSFAHGLVDERKAGLWHELQTADPTGRLFDDVIYILVPAHVSSPRRVKVLLNNFATNARIAEARHIDWVARARELAVLTALETEFPTVANAIIQFPQVLSYIRGDKPETDPELSTERRDILESFRTESVAGDILRDRDRANGDPIVTNEEKQSDDRRETRAKAELARQLRQYLAKLKVVSGLNDPRPDLLYLRVIGYEDGITDPDLGEMLDMAPDREPDAVMTAFAGQPADIRTAAVKLLLQLLATTRGTGQANVLESACRLAEELPEESIRRVAYLAPEVINQVGQSTWRKAAIPGAVALVADQADKAPLVADLFGGLDLNDPDDVALLSKCVPALAWATDKVAASVHQAIAAALPTDVGPLTQAISTLPPTQANLALESLDDAVKDQYKTAAPADAVALLDELLQASLNSSDPDGLLWQAVFQAQNSRQANLVANIHTRRALLIDKLSPEHRTCVALYQIEIGPTDDWTDWIEHVEAVVQPITETTSKWAHDAALAIVRTLPRSHDDLVNIIHPVLALVSEDQHGEVYAGAVEQIASVQWGDPADPDGFRWKNLDEVLLSTNENVDDPSAHRKAIAASLKAAVTAQLPSITATAIPSAAVEDWRQRIFNLPKDLCSDLDTTLIGLNVPNPAASVVLLRLRIAVHKRTRQALRPAAILAVASEPTAADMAVEWLSLTPAVDRILKVHETLPFTADALGRYAKALNLDRRSSLWIALEKAGSDASLLKAVGRHGVDGSTILHMRSAVLNSPTQSERNAAAARLLTATLNEVPSAAERARGEATGHKEATSLALNLVATEVHENIVLAAQLVVESSGVAHGARGKLRTAFSKFANGPHSRNFTRDQARDLSSMELLDPKKRGRMSWLWDLLN